MKRNSGFIGSKVSTSMTSAIGVHDIHDQHQERLDTKWPPTKKITSITPSSLTVTEGVQFNIVVNGDGWLTSDTVYYKFHTVSGTTLVQADFVQGSPDGNFSFTQDYPTSNTITLYYIFKAEIGGLSENNVVKFQIYKDSGLTNLIEETANITVTDATGTYTSWAVSNPSIQWIWEANGFLTDTTGTISANTATENQDRWGFYNNNAGNGGALTETDWIADKDIVKTSYTTNNNKLLYYLTFENDLDFCPNSNTSNGADVITNGGYTYFFVNMPYNYAHENITYNGPYARYMTYQGFSAYTANFSGGRNPTSVNQHSNPGHYAYKTLNNTSNDTSLYYHPRGSGDTGSSNSAYSSKAYVFHDKDWIRFSVVVFEFGTADGTGSGYYSSTYRVSTKVQNTLTGAAITSYSNETYGGQHTTSSSGRRQYVNTTANGARPFFHDSVYGQDGAHDTRWVMAGFANRPYTTTESTNLLNELDNLYGA